MCCWPWRGGADGLAQVVRLARHVGCVFSRLPRWSWCQQHNVLLPDEFNQINDDIEQFWAIDPHVLRATQSAHESDGDTFTIGKESGHPDLELLTSNLTDANLQKSGTTRSHLQMGILDPVKDLIPPFRATWTAHDGAAH